MLLLPTVPPFVSFGCSPRVLVGVDMIIESLSRSFTVNEKEEAGDENDDEKEVFPNTMYSKCTTNNNNKKNNRW